MATRFDGGSNGGEASFVGVDWDRGAGCLAAECEDKDDRVGGVVAAAAALLLGIVLSSGDFRVRGLAAEEDEEYRSCGSGKEEEDLTDSFPVTVL